jgi:hypothetical protein
MPISDLFLPAPTCLDLLNLRETKASANRSPLPALLEFAINHFFDRFSNLGWLNDRQVF